MLYIPYPYQQTATSHILQNPAVLLAGGAGNFLDMGLGKSVSTATAAEILIYQWKVFDKVLIIAPKLVAEQTWPDEIQKWDHLQHMSVSVVAGSPKQRLKALQRPANVYCIGCDNISWLVAACKGYWPFPFVVIDELTRFKSSDSQRFKALRQMRPQMKKVVGLTGTPAPNGLVDLWAQIFLLDQGQRLGPYVTKFRQQYFTSRMTGDNIEVDFKIKKEKDPLIGKDIHAAIIADKIGDICISMKSEDYLPLEPINNIYRDVRLPDPIMAQYKQFAIDSVTQVQDEEITAFSAPALYGKLLQFANGAVYDPNGVAHGVHDAKLDMLEEIMEEAQGSPILVIYNFTSDVDRIKKRLARFKPHKKEGPECVRRWNRGEIPLFLIHSSAGIGINLQFGGYNLVWFGLPWGLEAYQQTCKRLHRMGQEKRVNNHVLLCPGTLEYKVAQRLHDKAVTQDDFMDAIKAEVRELKQLKQVA